MRIVDLTLQFKRERETIHFDRVSYFYGQMGAGKSSIARLIDYCLAGDLDLSPALQNEFNGATLSINIVDTQATAQRMRNSDQVICSWHDERGAFDAILPARKALGEVIPGTGVENLSDLLFYLSGIRPPRVRRSKVREDSELERLSIRDLLWYCYLDQDSMDSSFFNLEPEANPFKRNKSKDVLRYVVGFHQEQVAELESELQATHEDRLATQLAAETLQQALEESSVFSPSDLRARLASAEQELRSVAGQLTAAREAQRPSVPHAADSIRTKARDLTAEVTAIEEGIAAVQASIENDQRHSNELRMLELKYRRASAARAVLGGVEFTACPRCARELPVRETTVCPVCGQDDTEDQANDMTLEVIRRDVAARSEELDDMMNKQRAQLRRMQQRQSELLDQKQRLDHELVRVLAEYDSAFLSSILHLERRKAEIEQLISKLHEYGRLVDRVQAQFKRTVELEAQEQELRRKLKEARAQAERDTSNLKRLGDLFLDCLVRSRLPGISAEDRVSIRPPNFLPEVAAAETGDLAVTSFTNISSGGKKSLFKCCFAIALHRLAAEIGAILPTVLIIDSPMKNISERENREQFEGFHRLLYELAEHDLSDTQFVIIDKEFCQPPDDLHLQVSARHMRPDDPENPPLVRYYRGH